MIENEKKNFFKINFWNTFVSRFAKRNPKVEKKNLVTGVWYIRHWTAALKTQCCVVPNEMLTQSDEYHKLLARNDFSF